MLTVLRCAAMLEVGQQFERKYVIEELLGAGGFALVYRAHQPDVDRSVAIKILRPAQDIGTHPATLLARFQREAKMAAELRNEHNIRLFDFGRSSTGFLYMIFEFVDGLALDELIRRTGSLSPRRVVKILRQLLAALSEAHQLGILHRDVKPQNIIIFERLGKTDRAKLIDYGIAKPMGKASAGQNITAEGHVVGTPRYMAPEQILMLGELTPATDIYSLGLVAYEMLAGEGLLGDSTHTEVIKRQLSGEVFMVPPTVPAPPGLRRVIDKMLAKSARDRYQSADDILADLETIDLDEAAQTVPPVDQLLGELSDSNLYDSQDRPSTEDGPPTIDSRPMGQLQQAAERVREAERSQDSAQAPPTLDSNPEILRRALSEDAPSIGNAAPTVEQGPKRRVGLLIALGGLFILAMLAVAIVAVVLSRSQLATRVADKIDSSGMNAGCPGEDEWEPNNRSFKGTLLHEGSKRGYLCPGDIDWFRLGHYSAGDVVTWGVEYEEGDGDDIDAELFVDAEFVGGVWTSEMVERMSQKLPKAGIVAVRLYFPKVDGGGGRGYRITRDMDSLPPPPESAAEPTAIDAQDVGDAGDAGTDD